MVLGTLLLWLSAAAPAQARPAVEVLGAKVAAALAAQRVEGPFSLEVSAPHPALAQALSAEVARNVSLLDKESPDVRSRVSIEVSLRGQQLSVRGQVASTWVNFWAGASARPAPPQALPELTQEADAAAIALASGQASPQTPPTPRVPLALKTSPLAQLPQVPAALACRDVDGDGKAELAVLGAEAVFLFGGDGKLLARYEVRGPLAKQVAREPFGAVALTARPTRIAFFDGRHELGQTLEFDRGALKSVASGEASATLEGLLVRPAPGLNSFAPEVRLGDRPLALPAPLQSVAASRGFRLLQLANGALALLRPEGTLAPLLSSGAAAALADFDGDGTPEVLTSARESFPRLEVLAVHGLRELEAAAANPGAALALWTSPLARGRALVAAGCDLNGDGKEEAVVGAWLDDGTGELSVVGAP